MKKTIVLVLMLMCVFALSACSKKEEGGLKASDLVGKWEEDVITGTETWTFNEDMTYEQHIVLDSYGNVTEDTYTNKYEINGDEITIHFSVTSKTSTYKVAIEGDKMTWTYVENGSTMEFTRIKDDADDI